MIYTQHFIIEGKHLGSATRNNVFVHEQVHPPTSYGFFCGNCGDLWAKCPVTDAEYPEVVQPWQVWTRHCRKCRASRFAIPGSLFLTWDASFNLAANSIDGVVKWEFDRCMAMYPETTTTTLETA